MPDQVHSETMRTEWDQRARSRAHYYIVTDQENWDEHEFFASGERDVRKLVEPILRSLSFASEGKTVLEVGCGLGRMTRSFADRFGQVYALDVSPQMLERARALNATRRNIVWLEGNGAGLPGVTDEQVDFVFSYLVLQHIPSPRLALGYIREMIRVLRTGGVFLLQFNSQRTPMMNWRGRLVWSVIDRLREPILGIRMTKAGHVLASAFGLDALAAGKTWRGAILDGRDVLEAVWDSGGAAYNLTGWGTAATWCYGRKIRHAEPAPRGE